MNREKAKELFPVIHAFMAGKPIQFRDGTLDWTDFEGACPALEADELEWRTKPEKEKAWLNIYKNSDPTMHISENLARFQANTNGRETKQPFACICIEYYEGQGLD